MSLLLGRGRGRSRDERGEEKGWGQVMATGEGGGGIRSGRFRRSSQLEVLLRNDNVRGESFAGGLVDLVPVCLCDLGTLVLLRPSGRR